MNKSAIQAMATSPAAFREALVIKSAHGPRRFGDVMAPFQRDDFAALDPAFLALAQGRKPERGRFWIERTKGGSKDSDLAVMMLWLLAFATRPVRIQIGAYDSDQADEIRLIIAEILRLDGPLNKLLAEVTSITRGTIKNTRTDSVCEILTTDSKGSHGSRPDLVLVNELSHIGNQEFAETLLDNADKVPHGVVCIATNAGQLGTWQYAWHELARTSDRWHFSALTEPSPWIDPADLEESRRRNSASRFARLWRGQWVAGGDALDHDDIERAVTLRGPELTPSMACRYVLGVDLATRRDHAAIVLLGANGQTRRVHLAYARSWKPGPAGVDLTDVQAGIACVAQRFRAKVVADPWQATLMLQQLTKAGVNCVEMPFSAANMTLFASRLLEAFREGRVDLYRDGDGARLIADLGRMSIVEKPPFGYKLTANADPRAGHADVGFAFAIALPTAMDLLQRPTNQITTLPYGFLGASRLAPTNEVAFYSN